MPADFSVIKITLTDPYCCVVDTFCFIRVQNGEWKRYEHEHIKWFQFLVFFSTFHRSNTTSIKKENTQHCAELLNIHEMKTSQICIYICEIIIFMYAKQESICPYILHDIAAQCTIWILSHRLNRRQTQLIGMVKYANGIIVSIGGYCPNSKNWTQLIALFRSSHFLLFTLFDSLIVGNQCCMRFSCAKYRAIMSVKYSYFSIGISITHWKQRARYKSTT